jgi:hypothetical protein
MPLAGRKNEDEAMAVEAAANAMVTLDEVKRFLALTGTDMDEFLQEAINDWSGAIEDRCNRRILSASYEDEIHDGGKIALIPRNIPVTAISGIEVDGTALTSDEYSIDREGASIRMKSGLAFAGGPGSILLSYTGGYESAPGDLRLAVKKLVGLEYYLGPGRKTLAKRGESTREGNVTYERGPGDQEKIIDGIVRRYGRK